MCFFYVYSCLHWRGSFCTSAVCRHKCSSLFFITDLSRCWNSKQCFSKLVCWAYKFCRSVVCTEFLYLNISFFLDSDPDCCELILFVRRTLCFILNRQGREAEAYYRKLLRNGECAQDVLITSFLVYVNKSIMHAQAHMNSFRSYSLVMYNFHFCLIVGNFNVSCGLRRHLSIG